MSNNYISLIFFFFILNFNNIWSSTIILPFSYKNKKEYLQNSNNNEINTQTSYFEQLIDNTIYTSMKVYNQEIDFHLSMERYPIYINDEIYKKFNDKNIDNKKETLSLYSLDRIGINRASLINKTFTVKSNTTLENEIEEINLFRARKFLNFSENEKNRRGYASEEAEIGFNIVRGSQYQYVEETENDIDTEDMKEEYEREKEREKAYEEFYNLKNKTNSDLPSYNPLDEYDYPIDDYDEPNRPYKDEDIFNSDEVDGNYSKTVNKKTETNNKKKRRQQRKRKRKIFRRWPFQRRISKFYFST